MPRYLVKFAHQDETREELHGWGSAEIDTDVPVTTDAHRLEVARSLGLYLGKTKLAVMEIIEKHD